MDGEDRRRTVMRRAMMVLGAVLAAGTAQAGETIRCGRWVVDESATVEELVQKCGEPASKRRVEKPILVENPDNTRRMVGTTVTEYWTYDRGTRAFQIVVTIVDGRIRSIERAE